MHSLRERVIGSIISTELKENATVQTLTRRGHDVVFLVIVPS
jgi:hypothetical protein